MGNYASSCIPRLSHRPPSASVADINGGRRRRVSVPVTAAELMLEEPLHVVCAVDDLRKTGRVLPMRADDELAAGMTYLLIPSARVNGRISEQEMAAAVSSAGQRRRRHGGRVAPAGTVKGDRLFKVSALSGCTAPDGCFGCQRLGNHWRPVLEPILEVA